MTGVLSCTIVITTLVPAHAFAKTTDDAKTHQQLAKEYEAKMSVNSTKFQSESNENIKNFQRRP
ncbi:hypothetical protein ACLBXI_27470 [Bacillus cereus]